MVALATVLFVALLIFGLGVGSVLLDADVIATPGLGTLPGVLGIGFAVAAFGVAVASGLRPRHPSFFTALWAALAAALAHLAGVWTGALFVGAGPAVATSVVGQLALGWVTPVVLAAASATAWAAVALVRTRTRGPRWPWERDDAAE